MRLGLIVWVRRISRLIAVARPIDLRDRSIPFARPMAMLFQRDMRRINMDYNAVFLGKVFGFKHELFRIFRERVFCFITFHIMQG